MVALKSTSVGPKFHKVLGWLLNCAQCHPLFGLRLHIAIEFLDLMDMLCLLECQWSLFFNPLIRMEFKVLGFALHSEPLEAVRRQPRRIMYRAQSCALHQTTWLEGSEIWVSWSHLNSRQLIDCCVNKCVFTCTFADQDDPLKTTDQTRPLGLIVSFSVFAVESDLMFLSATVLWNKVFSKGLKNLERLWCKSVLSCPVWIIGSCHLAWQVCRGTAVMLVAPTDGTEEIPNPFLQPESVAAWVNLPATLQRYPKCLQSWV